MRRLLARFGSLIKDLVTPAESWRRSRTQKLDGVGQQAQQDAIGYSQRGGG